MNINKIIYDTHFVNKTTQMQMTNHSSASYNSRPIFVAENWLTRPISDVWHDRTDFVERWRSDDKIAYFYGSSVIRLRTEIAMHLHSAARETERVFTSLISTTGTVYDDTETEIHIFQRSFIYFYWQC